MSQQVVRALLRPHVATLERRRPRRRLFCRATSPDEARLKQSPRLMITAARAPPLQGHGARPVNNRSGHDPAPLLPARFQQIAEPIGRAFDALQFRVTQPAMIIELYRAVIIAILDQ